MWYARLSRPELALFAGTRGMLGAGIGLLLGKKLSDSRRKGIGWTLLIAGAGSTIPLAIRILHNRRQETPNEPQAAT
jgi:hypothetical protein